MASIHLKFSRKVDELHLDPNGAISTPKGRATRTTKLVTDYRPFTHWRFDGDRQWSSVPADAPEVPPGKRRVLRCKCGGNDWTEDGRTMNEYCCACCNQYLEAI